VRGADGGKRRLDGRTSLPMRRTRSRRPWPARAAGTWHRRSGRRRRIAASMSSRRAARVSSRSPDPPLRQGRRLPLGGGHAV